jgi:uncharacterized protein YdeI (YjbR/CyaY-like superfamily)
MEKMPADLNRIFTSNPKVKAKWNELTPIARRDFISWIEGAKQQDTRKRRIDRIPSMLASGKKRPCCYAIVPMNLYKALNANSKAKSKWKNLTPDERRDFVDWLSGAKDPNERSGRIDEICKMIAQGKRGI